LLVVNAGEGKTGVREREARVKKRHDVVRVLAVGTREIRAESWLFGAITWTYPSRFG